MEQFYIEFGSGVSNIIKAKTFRQLKMRVKKALVFGCGNATVYTTMIDQFDHLTCASPLFVFEFWQQLSHFGWEYKPLVEEKYLIEYAFGE